LWTVRKFEKKINSSSLVREIAQVFRQDFPRKNYDVILFTCIKHWCFIRINLLVAGVTSCIDEMKNQLSSSVAKQLTATDAVLKETIGNHVKSKVTVFKISRKLVETRVNNFKILFIGEIRRIDSFDLCVLWKFHQNLTLLSYF